MAEKVSVLMVALLVSVLASAQNAPSAGNGSAIGVATAALPNAPRQVLDTAAAPVNAPNEPKAKKLDGGTEFKPFGVGVGFMVSSLGFGGQVAVSLTKKTNARFAFNAFNFSKDFAEDQINFTGTLGLKSIEGLVDFFPFGGGFHISGGALMYNGNQLTATAHVPTNSEFTLDDVHYYTKDTPITGSGKLRFNKFAPEFLFGFGNLVPRTKHISGSFEAGVAYHGNPKATLSLAGIACPEGQFTNCPNIATDSLAQSRIKAEQDILNNDASPIKFWPIIRFGFGYRF